MWRLLFFQKHNTHSLIHNPTRLLFQGSILKICLAAILHLTYKKWGHGISSLSWKKKKKKSNSPSYHLDRKKSLESISPVHNSSECCQRVARNAGFIGSSVCCWEKWIPDLVCEGLQITMILETGLWATFRAELLICDLATISQVLCVIFTDIDNIEKERMVLVLFGFLKFLFVGCK